MALIVGGARGIGRATASAFAADEKARIAVIDLAEEVPGVAADIHACQSVLPALATRENVSDFAAMQRAAGACQQQFGRIDHVVFTVCCPIGYWPRGKIEIVCARFGIPLVESLLTLIELLRRGALAAGS